MRDRGMIGAPYCRPRWAVGHIVDIRVARIVGRTAFCDRVGSEWLRL